MTDTLRLTKEEKKTYFLEKILSFQVRITPKKIHKFVFRIGSPSNQHVVCKKGFVKAHTISRWYVDDVINRYKCGHKSGISELNEKTSIPASVLSDKTLMSFAEEFGISLTPEHLGNLRMADGVDTKLTVAWMTYYFSLVGDFVPNSNNEIHLEPIPRSDVYKEYLFDMKHIGDGESGLTLDSFRKIWKEVFPHVRIRKYKSSCGHCNLCSILSDKRRKFRDRKGREEVTNLFALHRLSTMGERRTYYNRRLEAELNPTIFLSTIADGMQQNHCMLPWYGNNKMPPKHVKQHLQGVYMHGDNMTIYRTYANVGGGANLAIHTWLLSLEDYSRRHNHNLPRVLYHQIDGGPENANAEFLAVCALLVACGVFDKIVLTRLPVGHTHEDIDALFALIWKRLRDEHIYTPSEFANMVYEVLKRKVKVNVVDVYALPDYVSLFKDCIDPKLARYCKEEWAQLQFTFESVEVSDIYPTGVKTTYRAYTQDTYIEIVEDESKKNSVCGLIPQECIVKTRPLPGEAPIIILKQFPSADIVPAPFIAGSRELINSVASYMISQHTNSSTSGASDEWKLWSTEYAPQSDNVQDYLTTKCGVVPVASKGTAFVLHERNESDCGIYIPFKERMFSSSGFSGYDVVPRQRGIRPQCGVGGRQMRVVESTSCVLHEDNSNAAARRVGSRVVVQDVNGENPIATATSQPKHVLNSVYLGREARRLATRRKNQEAKESTCNNNDVNSSAVNDIPPLSISPLEVPSDSNEGLVGAVSETEIITTTTVASTKKTSAKKVSAKNALITQAAAWKNSVAQNNVVTTANHKISKNNKSTTHTAAKKSTGSRGTTTTIVVANEWMDTGAVDASNVITGKRKRGSRPSKLDT
jgi:hypothetical protein